MTDDEIAEMIARPFFDEIFSGAIRAPASFEDLMTADKITGTRNELILGAFKAMAALRKAGLMREENK